MVVDVFSTRPFHASMGIMTTRLLLHLRKAAVKSELVTGVSDPTAYGISLKDMSIQVVHPNMSVSSGGMSSTSNTAVQERSGVKSLYKGN